MFFLKILLLPISLIYGLLVAFRNKLFDWNVFSSKSFPIPIISMGNITVGGTGKSPHVEYLIRLFKDNYQIGTLSRGYKRETSGFVLAKPEHTFRAIGDEPLQFYSKFPFVNVAVDENRVRGVKKMMDLLPDLDLVILDDAFQHRWISPGLNILLIEYSDIDDQQFMLPSGMLREFRSGRKRADVIIVTKSPIKASPMEHRRIANILKPTPFQTIFYSYIVYKDLVPITPPAKALFTRAEGFSLGDFKVLLITGIANPFALEDYLGQKTREVIKTEFEDHHSYSIAELIRIKSDYNKISSSRKIIITTEKDFMRLKDERLYPFLLEFPVFYLPIEIAFHSEEETFDNYVNDYVQKNKRER